MIIKRKSKQGTRFMAKVYGGLDPVTKKKVWLYGSSRESKVEAKKDEVRIQEAQASVLTAYKMSAVNNFQDLREEFIKSQIWEGFSQRTRDDYEYWWKKEIKKVFAYAKPSDINTGVLERWAVEMDKQWARSTWWKPMSQMKTMLKYARKNGIITADPFQDIDLPGTTAHGRGLSTLNALTTWSQAEVDSFLDFASETAPVAVSAMLRLSFSYGLRPGEVCGIRRKDVTLTQLHIEQGVSRDGLVTDLKTDMSHRALPMTPSMYGMLEQFLNKDEDDFIFKNRLRNPYTPEIYSKHFRNLKRKYNAIHTDAPLPDMPLYNARHTFATLAIMEQHWDPRILASVMGHTSVNTAAVNYISTADALKEIYEEEKILKFAQ